jgi:hypothetical protein
MAILAEWIVPGLTAIVLHVMHPDHYLFNSFAVIATSLFSSLEAVHWLLAGYVDTLYLSDGHRRSFYRILIFLSTPVVSRTLFFCWSITRLVIYVMWNNVVQLSTLSLCFGVSWHFLSLAWRKKIGGWCIEMQVWALAAPPNLIYGACVYLGIVSDSAGTFTRIVADKMRPQTPAFSYASAPTFDPHTQLRLLKLRRTIPFFRVSGELISCSINSAPPYHAISYTWEHGPNIQRTFIIDGMEFQVRQNVYDILQRCSSYFGPQLIWVDSICINQKSKSDKTLQVKLMQEIYSKAAHVLVCLGNGSAYLAIGLIFELDTVRQSLGDAFLTQHVAGFLTRRKTDLYLRARMKALHDLLQHPWFRRVWVVQEVVVAKKVTICYGQQCIPWPEFYEKWGFLSGPIVSMFSVMNTETDTFSVSQSYLGVLSLPLIAAYRMEYTLFGPQSMSHLLRVFGEREATQSVDKVFALVGMAKRYAPDVKGLVDYEHKTTDEVLLDLANFMLDHNEAMSVLDSTGIGAHGYNPNLPSWVVDWTFQRSGMPLHTDFAPETIKYHATKNKPARMIRGASRREVLVRGQIIDRISSIAAMPTIEDIPIDSTVATLISYPDTALAHAREHLAEPYLNSQPLAEAVWRTVIGDRTHSLRPAPPRYGASLHAQIAMMRDMGSMAQSFQPSQMMNDANLARLYAEWGEERVREIQEFNQDFQDIDMLYDDSKSGQPLLFCVTEKGYVGMVPRGSEVGDHVVLVYGMHVPCVMRKSEEEWRLVGAAYVHGIMDGEGLDFGCGEEDFVLV